MAGLWELVWGKPQVDPHRLAGLLSGPTLRGYAEKNWYILTGEPLP